MQSVRESFEEFFNIVDHWNIAPYPSQIGIANYLGSGFSLGFIFSLNTISKYGNLTADNDSFFAKDANIKYNLNTLFKTNRFALFLNREVDMFFLMMSVLDISI